MELMEESKSETSFQTAQDGEGNNKKKAITGDLYYEHLHLDSSFDE